MAKTITSKNAVVGKKTNTEKLSGLVLVVGTEKSEFLETGKEYNVTKGHANTLVKNGHAKLKKK